MDDHERKYYVFLHLPSGKVRKGFSLAGNDEYVFLEMGGEIVLMQFAKTYYSEIPYEIFKDYFLRKI